MTWQEVRIPREAFAASGNRLRHVPGPAALRSVAIVAYGRDHQAEIDVAEIGIY